jgi:hypothetical protein
LRSSLRAIARPSSLSRARQTRPKPPRRCSARICTVPDLGVAAAPAAWSRWAARPRARARRDGGDPRLEGWTAIDAPSAREIAAEKAMVEASGEQSERSVGPAAKHTSRPMTRSRRPPVRTPDQWFHKRAGVAFQVVSVVSGRTCPASSKWACGVPCGGCLTGNVVACVSCSVCWGAFEVGGGALGTAWAVAYDIVVAFRRVASYLAGAARQARSAALWMWWPMAWSQWVLPRRTRPQTNAGLSFGGQDVGSRPAAASPLHGWGGRDVGVFPLNHRG